MIPKYLKIKGLYSYQQEQEIHFDALTNAALFGIFGSVGSGKSSILEAITFALYGDTERLNKSGDDRTYNMMNLRSDELFIDFECIAGKDGHRYRFTVKGKRNSKNFKDVKTFERKGYSWKDEQWIPLAEGESTEAIIGLSYDNFRRTIIIPQGRFQEFIELRDADRTRMMKELFQLEKYDLSRKVSTLQGQNKEALAHVEGQLSSLTEVSNMVIDAEQEKHRILRSQIEAGQTELLAHTKMEDRLQKQKQALETISGLKKLLTDLEAQESPMQHRREQLGIFEICTLHFKPLLDLNKRLSETLKKEIERQETIANKILTLGQSLEKLRADRAQQLPSFQKRDELLQDAADLEKMVQILIEQDKIKKMEGSLQRGAQLLLGKQEALLQQKTKRQGLEKELEGLKNNLPDIAEVSRIESWYATMKVLTENKANTLKEANLLNEEFGTHQELFTKTRQTFKERFQLDLPVHCSLDRFEELLSIRLTQYQEQVTIVDTKILEIQTKARLVEFAEALKDGGACPLCGPEHHPAMLHANDQYSQALKERQEQKVKLHSLEKELRKEQTSMDRMFQKSEHFQEQKKLVKLRWEEGKRALDNHEKAFAWPQFDLKDPASFKKYTEQVQQLQKQIKALEQGIKETSLAIDKEEVLILEKFEKPLQTLRDELIKAQNTSETLSAQLVRNRLDSFADQDQSTLSSRALELKQKHAEIQRIFEELEIQIAQVEKESSSLSGEQSSLLRNIESHKADSEQIRNQLQQLLIQHEYKSEEWVRQILNQNMDMAEERKILDAFSMQLHTVRRDLAYQLAQNPADDYNADLHETTTQKVLALTIQLQENRKEEGRLEGLIKKLQEDLLRRTSLLKEQQKLEIRKNHLNDLAKLFRSSGFVDYASSIYLQNLIQSANTRFHQMTHQQLHLELGEGNSFWVRDLLNGGHLRLLKTLSGGQKFQAALSLALALADHIHIRNASKHNFFFLDEGFGSLDKAALQTVFETLKSLRKENRIVGIISHVEELQQEIQTYLKIEESETGSRIVKSWE